jgi:hypothetical protein
MMGTPLILVQPRTVLYYLRDAGMYVYISRWVTEQLRRHAARSSMSFADQLVADAARAGNERPARRDAVTAGKRMERSAPW